MQRRRDARMSEMNSGPWSDGERAVAKGMWLQGERMAVIGARIKRRPDAVSRQAKREGWGPHPAPKLRKGEKA